MASEMKSIPTIHSLSINLASVSLHSPIWSTMMRCDSIACIEIRDRSAAVVSSREIASQHKSSEWMHANDHNRFRVKQKIDCELFIWCISEFYGILNQRIWILCHLQRVAVIDLLLIFDNFYSAPTKQARCFINLHHFMLHSCSRFLHIFSPRKWI